MDENLREYATPGQWEALCAIWECGGSPMAAARKLGKCQSQISRQRDAVLKKAAMHGYAPDYNLTHPVAPGFRIKGTSTLYDKTSGEAKIQWIKTTVDDERREEAFKAALEGFKADIEPDIPTVAPDNTAGHLITCYPIGDHHFGMLAWGEETGGEDYELTRGAALLRGAMDHLVSVSPDSQQAAILILGDFMHYDGMQAITPTHGHLLDADSRFPKMVRVAIKSIRYLVTQALRKHEHVTLIIEIGNHDLSSAIFLMEMFAELYSEEPRVKVDNSPRNVHCFQFGNNMIGTHHGHRVKMQDLPSIFANDWPKIWGATEYRYFHTGHVHHDNVKELVGGVAESHRILPPADAHSAHGPWRSKQSMKSIVYHAEYGEVARHTVTPAMLEK